MAVIDPSVPRTFGEVLGGLMGAVIDAQSQAARATVDFIKDVGTLEGAQSSETVHELRSINFNFTKKDEHDKVGKYTLELPLLSLVEIPAISIKTAKFSFNYEVVATQHDEGIEEKKAKAAEASKGRWLSRPKPLDVIGRVKKESASSIKSETNAGIQVDVEFEKSTIAVGLERILDMLEISATEKPIP